MEPEETITIKLAIFEQQVKDTRTSLDHLRDRVDVDHDKLTQISSWLTLIAIEIPIVIAIASLILGLYLRH